MCVAPWEGFAERAASWTSIGARRPWLMIVAVGAVVGVLAGAAAVVVGRAGEPPASESVLPRAVRVTTTTAPPPPLLVYLAGAVNRPGIVHLAEGARLVDAIEGAGGARADADLARVNLAERVVDGTRVYVPTVGEDPPAPVAPEGGGTSGGGEGGGAPLDLNHATEDQLDALPGIGPATAAAIVAHRRDHGSFQSVDDLLQVRGIGPAKLESLRSQVRV
jgi:competence protein ComEA